MVALFDIDFTVSYVFSLIKQKLPEHTASLEIPVYVGSCTGLFELGFSKVLSISPFSGFIVR